jgi:predicted nucleic acid-binding protein
MIFIDSNIPMYLVGAPHANKDAAIDVLERVIARRDRMVTSAEVLQEILHRYHHLDRPDAIQPAFDAILGITDEVFPIELSDVHRAHALLRGTRGVSSRDALHVAVMERHGVDRIMSFDRGFDAFGTIERVY